MCNKSTRRERRTKEGRNERRKKKKKKNKDDKNEKNKKKNKKKKKKKKKKDIVNARHLSQLNCLLSVFFPFLLPPLDFPSCFSQTFHALCQP